MKNYEEFLLKLDNYIRQPGEYEIPSDELLNQYSWDNLFNELINTGEVEKMCAEYPALDKAYRNFRQIYDLVKADYKSKNKKA